MEELMKTELTEQQAKIIKRELDKLGPDTKTIDANTLRGIFRKARVKANVPKEGQIEYGLFYESIEKPAGKTTKKKEEKTKEEVFKKEFTPEQAEIIAEELENLGDVENIEARDLKRILKKADVDTDDIPDDAVVELHLLKDMVESTTSSKKSAKKSKKDEPKEEEKSSKGRRKKAVEEEEEEKSSKGKRSKKSVEEEEEPEKNSKKEEAKKRETRKHKKDEGNDEKPAKSLRTKPKEKLTNKDYAEFITKQLPPGQVKDLEQAFKALDKEEKGKIDPEDLKKALEEFGKNADQKTIEAIKEGIEENGDKKIDFDDFLILMTGAKPIDFNNKKDLEKLFKEFDIDGDGKISSVDLITTNDELGEDASGEEIKRMLLVADEKDDHKIDFDDFYYIMTVDKDQLAERKQKLAKEVSEKEAIKEEKKAKAGRTGRRK